MGKVLTLDQLKQRGWSLVNRCVLCLEEEETVDHILLHVEQHRHFDIFCSTCLGCLGFALLSEKFVS